MCGIFCTVFHNRNIFLNEIAKKGDFRESNAQFSEFYEAFRNRGPDSYKEALVEVSPYTVIQFAGSVLWTQGPAPVPQPFSQSDNNILLWNGDIFFGPLEMPLLGESSPAERKRYLYHENKRPASPGILLLAVSGDENDTKALYEKLVESSKQGLNIVDVFSTVRGPYSFIFYDGSRKTLYFGRDAIGRHSLLIGFSQRSITISSVACKNAEGFTEVPAVGIFSYNLQKDGERPLTLYPWSHISESVIDFPHILHKQSQIGPIIQAYLQPPRRGNKIPLASDLEMWSVQVQDYSLEQLLGKLSVSDSKSRVKKTMASLIAKPTIEILVEDLLNTLKESVRVRVSKQPQFCKNCMKIKLDAPEKSIICRHSKIGILFSGGLDSSVLASLAHNYLPPNESIDLLNVAFEKPAKIQDKQSIAKQSTRYTKQQPEISFDVPDRLTGLSTLEELKTIHPERKWNFVKINVTQEELKKERDRVISNLIYPLQTVLDDSLGCALWFASRGRGVLHDSNEPYISPCRILLSGIGADEQLGGYMRHRSTLKHRGGWEALDKELQYELTRISQRNLGRDDRVASDHGRQLRMPFLDEDVVNYLSFLSPWHRCFPVESMPPGLGDKLLLRLLAWKLGFRQAANLPKRAMQFGSRIANSGEKGSDVSRALKTGSEMSVNSYDAVAEKILSDLESAIKKYPNIDEFYIIPKPEEQNKNCSPIIKGENTLGLESWTVTHIYPYAHHQIMQKSNYKGQNICKVISCLTGVALLNPDMPTVWNRRKELIMSKKLQVDGELRLTRMALYRKPKCNNALMHRRWIITELLKNVQDKSSLLMEELKLSEMIANRYHSNYHAWSHRMWSLQHLLPDSPFLVKKKPQKNVFLDTSLVELSEIVNLPISRSEYSYMKSCDVSRVYFEELENNFKWISSHVSDHSGLHFRKFLITEILSFLKMSLILSSKMESRKNLDYRSANAESNLVLSILSNGQANLTEFLGSFSYGNQYERVIENYLINLGQELSLFDVAMFLIVTELKSNYSLCLLFLNHEALWYYRRFLIFIYKQLIDAFDYNNSDTENRLFLHLDKNGVPYRKDFKYDNPRDLVAIPKHSDFYSALYFRLVANENEIISKINVQDEHVKSLVENYSHWLKQCFNANEKFT